MGGTYSDVTTETRNGRWCEMTKRGGLMPVVHHRVGPRGRGGDGLKTVHVIYTTDESYL